MISNIKALSEGEVCGFFEDRGCYKLGVKITYNEFDSSSTVQTVEWLREMLKDLKKENEIKALSDFIEAIKDDVQETESIYIIED